MWTAECVCRLHLDKIGGVEHEYGGGIMAFGVWQVFAGAADHAHCFVHLVVFDAHDERGAAPAQKPAHGADLRDGVFAIYQRVRNGIYCVISYDCQDQFHRAILVWEDGFSGVSDSSVHSLGEVRSEEHTSE